LLQCQSLSLQRWQYQWPQRELRMREQNVS
jgi:hypothetical protein